MKKKVYLHNKSLLREFLKDVTTYTSEEFKDLPEDALVITPLGYSSPLERHDVKNAKFEMVLENLYEGSSTFIRLLYQLYSTINIDFLSDSLSLSINLSISSSVCGCFQLGQISFKGNKTKFLVEAFS